MRIPHIKCKGISFTSGPVNVLPHNLDKAVVQRDSAVVPAVRVKLRLVEAHVATLVFGLLFART